jgi:hypothetical protein
MVVLTLVQLWQLVSPEAVQVRQPGVQASQVLALTFPQKLAGQFCKH